jgi:DNA-binding CsgD family transcriptional regulator
VTLDLVGPFVGREKELTVVHDAVTARRSVLIVGEPGSGRSRLLSEYLGRHAPQHLLVSGVDGLRKVPLGALLAVVGDPPEIEPQSVISWAIDAVVALAGRDGVIGVDDVDQLDDITGGVLRLVARLHGVPSVMTMSGAAPPPADVLAAWRDGSCWRVDLAALDVAESRRMVEALLGHGITDGTAQRLWAVTLGNPLFLRELVHEGLELGRLTRTADDSVWAGPMGRGRRVHDIVMAQLSSLPVRLRRGLDVLAVGAPLRHSVAASLIGDPAIARLEDDGVVRIVRDPLGDHVEFVRPVVQHAVAMGASAATQRRAAARMLDAFHLLDGADLSLAERRRLAEWCVAAGRKDADLLFAGAKAALRLHDLDGARTFAEEVLRGDASHRGARSLLAAALEASGRHADTVTLLDSAPGDHEAGLEWAIRYSTNAFLSGAAREEALGVLASIASPTGHVGELQATQAWIELFDGDVRTAAQTAHAVLDDPASSTTAIVWASVAGSVAGAFTGETVRSDLDLGLGMRLLDSVAQTLPFARMQVGLAEIVTRLMTGRWREARCVVPTEDGDITVACAWAGFLGLAAKEAGDLLGCRHHLLDSVAMLGDLDPFQFRRLTMSELAACHAVLGDPRAAADALAAADGSPDGPGLYGALEMRNRAWVAAAGGRTAAAADALAAAKQAARRKGHDVVEALVLVDMARLVGRPVAQADRRRLAGGGHPVLAMLIGAAVALGDRRGPGCAAAAEELAGAGSDFLAGELAAAAVLIDATYRPLFHRLVPDEQRRWHTPLRARALAGGDPLTRREAEMAQLAASGLSSAAIAELMHVSVRTVDNHLGRVYRKLGVAGRAGLHQRWPATSSTP